MAYLLDKVDDLLKDRRNEEKEDVMRRPLDFSFAIDEGATDALAAEYRESMRERELARPLFPRESGKRGLSALHGTSIEGDGTPVARRPAALGVVSRPLVP